MSCHGRWTNRRESLDAQDNYRETSFFKGPDSPSDPSPTLSGTLDLFSQFPVSQDDTSRSLCANRSIVHLLGIAGQALLLAGGLTLGFFPGHTILVVIFLLGGALFAGMHFALVLRDDRCPDSLSSEPSASRLTEDDPDDEGCADYEIDQLGLYVERSIIIGEGPQLRQNDAGEETAGKPHHDA